MCERVAVPIVIPQLNFDRHLPTENTTIEMDCHIPGGSLRSTPATPLDDNPFLQRVLAFSFVQL